MTGPAERTIFGPPALSDSLQPGFSVHNTGHGIGDYGHFISFTSANGRTTVQRKVSNWLDGVRTHHCLSYGHQDILQYQAI